MKTAFLKTFGCKVNQYESQLIQERFKSSGYSLADSYENADIALINSCTVTAEADRECRQLIRRIQKRNPQAKIILTGCYLNRAPEELRKIFSTVTFKKNKEKIFNGEKPRPGAITSFDKHTRAFVKIQDGCDAFCSYCIVPYVRPKLTSRDENEILHEISELVGNGYPEIVLSGIRLGKYAGAGGLPGLLSKAVKLPGIFRIRLSSLEPGEVTPELIDLMSLNRNRICWHLHVPLQSGSDNVLKLMNRPYRTSAYIKVIANIMAKLPEAGVTTDVIVGFPGETEKDFDNTYDFINKCGFSRLHVFKFSEREGTAAANMPGAVDADTAKNRSKRLRELDTSLQRSFWKKFVAKILNVVRESESGFLISDNYIRIAASPEAISGACPIFNAKISEKNGLPFGIPYK
ncbi:MAG: tRNA (N(6)-L-threonylcarbamoyladenosine(37)-C(2))-methylthiotransferase MtaB [Elusimicrobiota bacterium]